MGDTRGGSGVDLGRDLEGVPNGTDYLLKKLSQLVEQQKRDSSGQRATQALKIVVD
jgi:hypothetical protein